MAIDAYGWFVGGNPKIEGETQDETVKKDKGFDIKEFAFAVQNQVNVGSSGGGLGSGKAVLEKLTFKKYTDTATTNLVLGACTGAHYDEFHLSLRKGGADAKASGGEFVHVTLSELVIESVSWSGADGDEALYEDVTIAYSGIKIHYKKQDNTGKLSDGGTVEWNQQTNKPKM